MANIEFRLEAYLFKDAFYLDLLPRLIRDSTLCVDFPSSLPKDPEALSLSDLVMGLDIFFKMQYSFIGVVRKLHQFQVFCGNSTGTEHEVQVIH